jgi:acetylornithine deacetylase/succinyl-diaminopimelate desuccinylase-like protein
LPASNRRLSKAGAHALCALLLAAAACDASAASSASSEAGLLAAYLRFDTSNPPGNEAAAIDWLAARAREAGARTEILRSSSGRPNLVARLPATIPAAAQAPVVVLLHHADVVPPGDGWSFAPFGGEIAGGAVRGRGAIDSKSLGIAHLAALAAAAKLPERRREILLLAVADEEAGGAEGAGWLLASHPEILARVELVLNEGGANRSSGERLLYWGIEVEQKRPLWLEVRARGRGGHGSSAAPESAAHRLISGLARLVVEPPPLQPSRAGIEFLARLGKVDPRAAKAAAAARKIPAAGGLTAEDRRALAGYEPLLTDSLQVTMLAGADRVNVVPAEASARLDVRLLPETDAAAYLARLRERLGGDLEVEILQAAPQHTSTSSESGAYRELAAGLARLAPGVASVPLLIPATTDSRFFRERGVAAFGFPPFVLDPRELLTVHAADERISVAAFDRGVETMRAVVRALVAPPPAAPR